MADERRRSNKVQFEGEGCKIPLPLPLLTRGEKREIRGAFKRERESRVVVIYVYRLHAKKGR